MVKSSLQNIDSGKRSKRSKRFCFLLLGLDQVLEGGSRNATEDWNHFKWFVCMVVPKHWRHDRHLYRSDVSSVAVGQTGCDLAYTSSSMECLGVHKLSSNPSWTEAT